MRMAANEINAKILNFVVEYAKEREVDLPAIEDVDGNSTLDDLGFDSLDQAGMLTDIERDFDIDFTDEVLDKKLTLDDLLKVVTKTLNEKFATA